MNNGVHNVNQNSVHQPGVYNFSLPENVEDDFELFFKAAEAGDQETMMFLLPRLLTDIKLLFTKLKSEIPELHKILNDNNVELLFEQSEKNLEIIKNQDSSKRSRLFSKVFNALALVSSALLFIVAPSPVTATFFVMSLMMTIDQVVAEQTGNESLMQKSTEWVVGMLDKLEAFEGMPDWAKSLVSTVLTIMVMIAVCFLAAKGGAAALSHTGISFFSRGAAVAGQSVGMLSPQALNRFAQMSAAVVEIGQISSSVTASWFDYRVADFTGDTQILQADIDRIGVDVNKLIEYLSDLQKDTVSFDRLFAS